MSEASSTVPQYLFTEMFKQERSAETTVRIAPSSNTTENPFSCVELNDLTREIEKSESIIAGGDYSDVYMGTWKAGTVSTKVAIKVLRSQMFKTEDISKIDRRLKRQLRIWGKLDHPNIVSLYGITFGIGEYPAMVCQWMNQESLDVYLQQRPNLALQERLDICIGLAQGLSYLHSNMVIHGDLHPGNVLMNCDVAHLSGFGLTNVIAELQGPSFITSVVGGAVRWTAPELLQVELTQELAMPCDVYSFACICFYVITGNPPYVHIRNNNRVITEIMKRIQAGLDMSPPRPAESPFTDECWTILTQCWALDPTERPNIRQVEHLLQQLLT